MRGENFIQTYWRAFTQPGEAFRMLSVNRSGLKFSAIAVSITAILYTLVYSFLIVGGGQPFKPWLNIPLETYYRYNVFLCAPSMFLGWILAAGVAQVITRPFSSTGTFEQTLIVFGFGISIASWSTGIHDIITSFLGAANIINQHEYEIKLNTPTIWRTLLWVLMITYLVWFVALFSIGIKSVYGIKLNYSIILGLLCFIVYQSFFFIFNR